MLEHDEEFTRKVLGMNQKNGSKQPITVTVTGDTVRIWLGQQLAIGMPAMIFMQLTVDEILSKIGVLKNERSDRHQSV